MVNPVYMVSGTSSIPANAPEQAVFYDRLKSNIKRQAKACITKTSRPFHPESEHLFCIIFILDQMNTGIRHHWGHGQFLPTLYLIYFQKCILIKIMKHVTHTPYIRHIGL